MKTRKRLVRKIRWERVLAGLLCLCMVVSVLQTNTPVQGAEADNPPMEIQVWHFRNGKIEGDFDINQSKDNFTEGELLIRPVANTENGEHFTAFSITAGQSAVTNINYVQENMENSTATIKYNAQVPFVRINLYYTGGGDVAEGRDFGNTFSNSPQIDTTKEESKKIYDTSLGLHTDKTAKASGSDGRTFDVTLESWFTGENKANVGLILDASGSMAWTSKDIDKQITYNVEEQKEREALVAAGISAENINGDQTFWLTEENVEKLLDSTKTDNSLLGYSDYSYYVKDGRETVQEFVPLGYWDGGDTLEKGLIGYYKFNKSFKNEVTGREESKLIAKSTPYDESQTVSLADDLVYGNTDKKYKNDYLIIYQNTGDDPKPGIARNGTGRSGGSNLLLDTKLERDSFTISFAVSSNKSASEAEEKTRPFSEIMYIGPIGKGYTDGDHYRIYRDAADTGAGGFIKWDMNTAGGGSKGADESENVKSPITSQDGFFESGNAWDLVTYVVTEGKIATYVNGNLTEATGTLREDFFSDGPQRIIIGGPDAYSEASLLIDELRIYDRPLNAAEVKKIYDASNVANALIDDGEKVRVLAGLNPELKTTDQLKGWYYVNSTSAMADIEQRGTAKEFRTIKIENGSKEGYKGYEIAGEEGVPDPPDKGKWEKWDTELDNGASKFYLSKEGSEWKLCCVFTNSGSKSLYYSYVYEKDRDTKTKAEILQEALGAFVNKLAMASPESKVSAVRFSTNNFEGDDRNKLVMLNWTKAPTASSEIMNLKKAGGQALEGEDGEYNYLMTGGTYVATGLDTFWNKLKPDADEKGADKYLIIFTDGKDDSLKDDKKDETTNQELKKLAIDTAGNLKKDGWTIYCVMLNRGSAAIGGDEDPARQFLYSLIGTDVDESEKDNKYYAKYFRNTQEGDTLEKIFSDILGDVVYDLGNYCVQDYIDPRFDLIAQLRTNDERPDTEDSKLIHLKDDGKVLIESEESERDISKDGLKIWVESKTDAAQKATLYWDSSKHMYYLKWEKQTIPGCSKGVESLLVWRATFTLRAKDDFIGGNAVLTNGQAADLNYVYSETETGTNKSSGVEDMYQTGQTSLSGAPDNTFKSERDAYPSKGFPRVTVNVGLLSGDVEAKQTIYLGETVKPLEIAKDLVRALKDDDDEATGGHYYWEYLERYVNSEEAQGEEKEYDSLEAILSALIKEHTLTIPYYYLPAVETGEAPGVSTQTGTSAHRADKLGEITYTWEDEHGIQEAESENKEDGSYVTRSTATRIYRISAMYHPSDLEAREAANNGNGEIKEPLIRESAYKWDSKYKPAEGELQTEKVKGDDGADKNAIGTGTHTTKIVRGELALKVSAEKDLLNHLFTMSGGQPIRVQVNVDRVPETESEASLTTGSEISTDPTMQIDEQPLDITPETEPGTEPVYVKIESEKAETTETALSFYSYTLPSGGVSDESEALPARRPIGTYTLTLESELENGILSQLTYIADNEAGDYTGHFTVAETETNTSETAPALGAGETDSTDTEKYEEDHGVINQSETGSIGDYIANAETESGTGSETGAVKVYLGTKPGKSSTDPVGYLNERLGMVQIELQSGDLMISKEVAGAAADENDEFTFRVTLDPSSLVPLFAPASTTGTGSGTGGESSGLVINDSYEVEWGGTATGSSEISFNNNVAIFKLKDGGNLTIKGIPAGIDYTVEEVEEGTEAGAEDATPIVRDGYVVTTTNAAGTISATSPSTVTFTNTREPAEVTLDLVKILDTQGYTLPDSYEFTFKLEADESQKPDANEQDSITIQIPSGTASGEPGTTDNKIKNNASVKLTFKEMGTYIYTLTEIDGSDKHIAYNKEKASYKITVEVTEPTADTANALAANVTVEKVTTQGETESSEKIWPVENSGGSAAALPTLEFTNTYTPLPATLALNAVKELEGAAAGLAGRIFAFRISRGGDGMPMPAGTEAGAGSAIVNSKADGSIDFGKITFEKAGTYSYTIRELTPSADQLTSYDPDTYKGIAPDDREFTVEVTVSEETGADGKATGRLKAELTKVTIAQGSETTVYDGTEGKAVADSGVELTADSAAGGSPADPSEPNAYTLSLGTFTNRMTGNLVVEKIVDVYGKSREEVADSTEFTFQVKLTDAGGSEAADVNGAYVCEKYAKDGTKASDPVSLTFTAGVSAPFTLKHGERLEILGLLSGLGYTVEETTIQDGYKVTSKSGVVAEGRAALGEGAVVSADGKTASGSIPEQGRAAKAEFTNRQVGNLTVTKKVAGEDAQEQAKDFYFRVTLVDNAGAAEPETDTGISGTYGDMTFESGVAKFTLKHNAAKTATGLPAGIGYIVEECADGSYTALNTEYAAVVTSDANSKGTIVQNQTTAVEITNWKAGSLKVTKRVAGSAGSANDVFKFKVTFTPPTAPEAGTSAVMTILDHSERVEFAGAEPVEKEFTLRNGEFWLFTGIPEGTKYKVEELSEMNGAENANDYAVSMETVAQPSGTITEAGASAEGEITRNDSIEVVVTNTKNAVTPTLAVTKELERFGLALPKEYTFRFTLESITADEYRANDPVTDKIEKEVTFQAQPEGAEKLSDVIANFFAGVQYKYAGTYVYLLKETDTFEHGIRYDAGTHRVTVTITKGADAAGQLLPAVSVEKENEDGTYTPEQSVVFANEYHKGNLKVAKTVVGTATREDFHFRVTLFHADKTPADEVDGRYGDMDFLDGAAEFTLQGGRNKMATGLPEGLLYRVEETPNENYTTTPENGVAEGTIEHMRDAQVTFTNTWRQRTGSLTVTKLVTGADGETTRPFGFELTLYKDAERKERAADVDGRYGDMNFADGYATFELVHGGTAAASGLPAGLYYNVHETDSGDYDVREVNGEGRIPENDTAAAVFTNSRDLPDPVSVVLNVSKTLTYTAEPTDPYTFTFELNRAGDTEPIADDPVGEGLRITVDLESGNWSETSQFGPLTYAKAGTYRYVLRESHEPEIPGIHYDTTAYDVTVTVTETKNEAGQRVLGTSVEMAKHEESAENAGTAAVEDTAEPTADFENMYDPSTVSVALRGRKILNGVEGLTPSLQPRQFGFELRPVSGTVISEESAQQASLERLVTMAAADEYLITLESDVADISETDGVIAESETEPAAAAAESETEITEEITEAAEAETAETETEETSPETESETAEAADGTGETADPSAEETTEPAGTEAVEFETESAQTETEEAAEQITEPADGEFTETVSEAVSEETTEAAAEDTELSGGDEEEIVFDPSMEGESELGIPALIDDAEETGPTVQELDVSAVPMPQNTVDGVATARNAADGSVVFGRIVYSIPGIYCYEIREIDEGSEDIFYDQTVYEVTVTVSRNESGQLERTVAYKVKDSNPETMKTAAEFTNTDLTIPPAPTGDLMVEKIVTGEAGDQSQYFAFTVTMLNEDGTVAEDVDGTYGEITFAQGVAGFNLKHGERKVASGLPDGLRYKVEESGSEGYEVSYLGKDGTIEAGKMKVASITNHRDAAPSPSPSPTPSEEPSPSPTPSEEPSPSPTPSAVPSPSPTPSEEPSPSPTPSEEPSPSPTPSAVPSPSPTPSAVPSPSPSPSQSPAPTAAPESGKVTVTKSLELSGEAIAAKKDTFYVAIFEDDQFAEMVYGPVEIRFKNAHAASAEIEGLEPGHVYYVSEVDESGDVITTGSTDDGVAYEPGYPQGQRLAVDADGNGAFAFENDFHHLPESYYWPDDPDRTEPSTDEEPGTDAEPTSAPGSGFVDGGGSDDSGSGSVSANPAQTGDETPIAGLAALMLASGAALLAALAERRRRRSR